MRLADLGHYPARCLRMLSDSEIKHKLTVKQVRDAKRVLNNLLSLNDRIRTATPQDMEKITAEVLGKTQEQDEFLESVLLDCLMITPENLQNMEYLEAITKFNDLYTKSTQIEKKSEQR